MARDPRSDTTEATPWWLRRALQPEPPARPDPRERRRAAELRLRPVPEVRQGSEGPQPRARGLAGIEASRSCIDDLNVYPVPDGDTGTNMAETVRAAVRALEADETADVARGPDGRPRQLRRHPLAARARSARGDPTRPIDTRALSAALRRASSPPTRPFEIRRRGTILTVARLSPTAPRPSPRAMRRSATRSGDPRRGRGGTRADAGTARHSP